MAVTSFIPQLWSKVIDAKLAANLVFASEACSNSDHEEVSGILGKGSQVTVNLLDDPAIGDYQRNQSITVQLLNTSGKVMTIDHAKYFAFRVDDVDRQQAEEGTSLLNTATARSVYGLTADLDAFVADLMIAGAQTKNTVTVPAGADKANAVYAALLDLGEALDNADVPTDARFVVVPPSIKKILLTDQRFIDASSYGSNEPIWNGLIGKIAGFSVHVTTNIPKTASKPKVDMVAGHTMGTTVAHQINKVEALRMESTFGDQVRGLSVAGALVVRPECLATSKITFS